MSLQTLRNYLLCMLVACLQCEFAHADIHLEVGAFFEASALPVFVGDCAETATLCKNIDTYGRPNHSAYQLFDTDITAEERQTATESPTFVKERSDSLLPTGVTMHADSVGTPVDTLALRLAADSLAGKAGKPQLPKPKFVPNPQRALWLSLVFPGAGQIYNRKYWKLPIIYGGFLGCAYALMWNQQMYRDYSQAYLDIMDDNPNTNSYLEVLPPRYDITGREEQFKKLFKRKKDFYRRYRDLSAFCFVGVYLLSVVDAYVDAQLSEFDISPDLSMRVEPAVMNAPVTLGNRHSTAYGVGCSFRF